MYGAALKNIYCISFFVLAIGCSSVQFNPKPKSSSINRDLASASNEVYMSSLSINRSALVVTHAHRFYDNNQNTKNAIDRLVHAAKQTGAQQIIYLTEPGTRSFITYPDGRRVELWEPPQANWAQSSQWYLNESEPDLIVYSGGSVNVRVTAADIVSVGGAFGACQGSTVVSLIANYEGKDALNIRFVMEGLYGTPKETLKNLYSSYDDKKQFLSDMWNEYISPNFKTTNCDKCNNLNLDKFTFRLLDKNSNEKITVGNGIQTVNLVFESLP